MCDRGSLFYLTNIVCVTSCRITYRVNYNRFSGRPHAALNSGMK